MKTSNLTSALLFLIASLPLAKAQGTYTQIDYPGAAQTECYGINNAGDMVGWYEDTGGNWHGFLLSGGTYTKVDYPGATTTLLRGLNDVGQIVGYGTFGGNYDNNSGFVFNIHTLVFTAVSDPDANVLTTLPLAINNGGIVVGFVQYQESLTQFPAYGFELRGTTFTQIIAPPGASAVTQIQGITAEGLMVGITNSFSDPNFLLSHGKFQMLTKGFPDYNAATGINSSGTRIAGYYRGHHTTVGFSYNLATSKPEQIFFPGAAATLAISVNDSLQVTGFFQDSNGVMHGYAWTPEAKAKK
jgi:hypothetical protein